MIKYNLELMNEYEVEKLLEKKIEECRKVINSFIYDYRNYDRGDVENCCYMGVFKALGKYDGSSSFVSYAKLWMRNELANFRASELNMPENKETHRKRLNVLRYVADNNDFEPSDEELKELKVTRSEFDSFKYGIKFVNLDNKIKEDGDSTYGDIVSDEGGKSLHLIEYLEELVVAGDLLQEQLEIIIDCYLYKKTESMLAKELGISRQAVHKRKVKAEEKMKEILLSKIGNINEVIKLLTY